MFLSSMPICPISHQPFSAFYMQPHQRSAYLSASQLPSVCTILFFPSSPSSLFISLFFPSLLSFPFLPFLPSSLLPFLSFTPTLPCPSLSSSLLYSPLLPSPILPSPSLSPPLLPFPSFSPLPSLQQRPRVGVGAAAVLTALDLQGAVLLVQRVAPQVHHAGCSGGDSARREKTREEASEREGSRRRSLLTFTADLRRESQ